MIRLVSAITINSRQAVEGFGQPAQKCGRCALRQAQGTSGRKLGSSGFRPGRLRISVLLDLRSARWIQRPIWIDVLGVFRWVKWAIRVDMRLGLIGTIRSGIGIGHACIAPLIPSGIRLPWFAQELDRSLRRFGAARQAGSDEWSPGGHRY